jgi:4,5-dihydroxyphthalate decarboxylase
VLRLKTAIGPWSHHTALRDGSVTIPGVELEHLDGIPHAEIFRRMGRGLEFDVCEFSCVSYYAAREYDIPIGAIPVAPMHLFHHGDFLKNVHAGIEEPKDLEGKRVGTRTWTVTPGVLDRGILTEEYGVDLDSITWVLAESEHVAECQSRYTSNVIPGREENLFPRLASGDLDAGIAGSNLRGENSPDVVPLFSDAESLDRRQYERTGIVPVFTLIAYRESLLEDSPWLPEALYEGFKRSRAKSVEPNPTVARIVDGDPNPIGLTANRASFEELLGLARQQGIIAKPLTVDGLFPAFD